MGTKPPGALATSPAWGPQQMFGKPGPRLHGWEADNNKRKQTRAQSVLSGNCGHVENEQWHAGEHSQGDRVGVGEPGWQPNRGRNENWEAAPQAGHEGAKALGLDGPWRCYMRRSSNDWLSEHLHEPGLGGLALAWLWEAAPSLHTLSSSLHAPST